MEELVDAGKCRAIGLDENLGAANVELTPDDLRDIESAASKIKVEGARYPGGVGAIDRAMTMPSHFTPPCVRIICPK
jgi:diketogulonate reductase-like aldo/keto reductase